MKNILTLAMICTITTLFGQENLELSKYSQHYLIEDDHLDRIDYLKSTYGTNKVYPQKLESVCLIALSAYPE